MSEADAICPLPWASVSTVSFTCQRVKWHDNLQQSARPAHHTAGPDTVSFLGIFTYFDTPSKPYSSIKEIYFVSLIHLTLQNQPHLEKGLQTSLAAFKSSRLIQDSVLSLLVGTTRLSKFNCDSSDLSQGTIFDEATAAVVEHLEKMHALKDEHRIAIKAFIGVEDVFSLYTQPALGRVLSTTWLLWWWRKWQLKSTQYSWLCLLLQALLENLICKCMKRGKSTGVIWDIINFTIFLSSPESRYPPARPVTQGFRTARSSLKHIFSTNIL